MEASEFPLPCWIKRRLDDEAIEVSIPRDRLGFLGPCVKLIGKTGGTYQELFEQGWWWKGKSGEWKKCRKLIYEN